MSDIAGEQPTTPGTDPLLSVHHVPALRVGPDPTAPRPARLRLRPAVVDRLIGAQSLLPREFRLVVVTGHLPARLARLAGHHCPHALEHATGGAVDLRFHVEGGAEISGWSTTAPPGWDTVAAALAAVDLANADDTWWHWSFGDERWRSRTGAAVARYTTAL